MNRTDDNPGSELDAFVLQESDKIQIPNFSLLNRKPDVSKGSPILDYDDEPFQSTEPHEAAVSFHFSKTELQPIVAESKSGGVFKERESAGAMSNDIFSDFADSHSEENEGVQFGDDVYSNDSYDIVDTNRVLEKEPNIFDKEEGSVLKSPYSLSKDSVETLAKKVLENHKQYRPFVYNSAAHEPTKTLFRDTPQNLSESDLTPKKGRHWGKTIPMARRGRRRFRKSQTRRQSVVNYSGPSKRLDCDVLDDIEENSVCDFHITNGTSPSPAKPAKLLVFGAKQSPTRKGIITFSSVKPLAPKETTWKSSEEIGTNDFDDFATDGWESNTGFSLGRSFQ